MLCHMIIDVKYLSGNKPDKLQGQLENELMKVTVEATEVMLLLQSQTLSQLVGAC